MKKKCTLRNYLLNLFFFAFLLLHGMRSVAQLPFTDGFESGNFTTGNWTYSGGAQITNWSPAHGIYCEEGPATWGISKTIHAYVPSLLFIEFEAKPAQINTNCLIFRVKDSLVGTSVGIIINDTGGIVGVNGTGNNLVLANYTAGKWYAFKFILNMAAKTYDVYVDNVIVADDFAFFSSSFTTPYLYSWSAVATSGTCWIDDVNIYTGNLGVNEAEGIQHAYLFPNPVTDDLHISTKHISEYDFSFYNLAGQLLFESQKNSGDKTFNLSGFETGFYFALIRDEKKNLVLAEKIIKR